MVLHCFYLIFVFSQSFLPDCSVGLFSQLSSYTLELCFMPYKQVGEQNQKILYTHCMETGEIKRLLVDKDLISCSAMIFYIS